MIPSGMDNDGTQATNSVALCTPTMDTGPNEPQTYSQSLIEPHKDTAEILRQVEYYFSDENLPHDAHMLGLTGGDGNGPVSFGHIHAFRKMRNYKPRSRVLASLRQSTRLIVVDNKFIQRKEPLKRPIKVIPRVNETLRAKAIETKPWLTKGMLKPTGFEEYASDGPIRPEEYEAERKLFDPEEAFTIRIENAVIRYQSKRKMHQLSLQIFTKFLMFSGFDGGQRQFTGGRSDQALEGYDKDEIDHIMADFRVSTMVLDGLDEDQKNGATWSVDFKTIAKGFLSSHFLQYFEWTDPEIVGKCVNLLRNFYNYLLYHDVCPEYETQIYAARAVCDLAERELLDLAKADKGLPGNFAVACSTLHAGTYANLYRESTAEWDAEGDNMGLSKPDALLVFAAGVVAHGTEAQIEQLETAKTLAAPLKVVFSEELGLEVIGVEHASPQAREIYEGENNPFTNTIVLTTGKLHCVRWNPPHAPPLDLPVDVIAARQAAMHEKFAFIVEEDTLQHCHPGMKMEVTIKKLDLGVVWIDHVQAVYPSFFTWTVNEIIRDWKEPGPPKEWMERVEEKRKSGADKVVRDGDGNGVDQVPELW